MERYYNLPMRKEKDPRIETHEKFIVAPRFENNIDEYIDANDEKEISFSTIAKLLCMKVQDVEARYARTLQFLHKRLK